MGTGHLTRCSVDQIGIGTLGQIVKCIKCCALADRLKVAAQLSRLERTVSYGIVVVLMPVLYITLLCYCKRHYRRSLF